MKQAFDWRWVVCAQFHLCSSLSTNVQTYISDSLCFHDRYRISYQLLAAMYSQMHYLLNGTTYHASFCIAMGPMLIITGVATFNSGHPTVQSQRSKMSVSKRHQWLYKFLIFWTAFYSIYYRDFDPTHCADSHYSDCLPKVWGTSLWSPQERCHDDFTSLWADFCCTYHSVHVTAFHLWFLLELPNNWHTLKYDSHTCIAFLEEVGHFCPMSHFHPIIDAFWTLPFYILTYEQ